MIEIQEKKGWDFFPWREGIEGGKQLVMLNHNSLLHLMYIRWRPHKTIVDVSSYEYTQHTNKFAAWKRLIGQNFKSTRAGFEIYIPGKTFNATRFHN